MRMIFRHRYRNKATKNDENRLANNETLKAHLLETGHFPNKHDKRLNWIEFLVKIKAETKELVYQCLF